MRIELRGRVGMEGNNQTWKPCKSYNLVDDNFYNLVQNTKIDCKKNDWDDVWIVSGAERITKSTLTGHASMMFEDKRKPYDWREHYILSPDPDTVIKQLKYSANTSKIIDEAIKSLYKLNMWDKLQKLINQIYTVNGQNNNFSMINIPRKDDLNKFFRDGRAHYWIQVLARGVATVFVKDDSQFSDDIWCVKENLKLERKLSKGRLFTFLSTEEKIWIHRKMRNYVTTIHYTDLPEPMRSEYKAEKRKQEFEGLEPKKEEKKESRMKIQRNKLIKKMYESGNYTQEELSESLGLDQSSISKILNSEF